MFSSRTSTLVRRSTGMARAGPLFINLEVDGGRGRMCVFPSIKYVIDHVFVQKASATKYDFTAEQFLCP